MTAFGLFKKLQYEEMRSGLALPYALRSWGAFAREFDLRPDRPRALIEESLIPHYTNPTRIQLLIRPRSAPNQKYPTVRPNSAKLRLTMGLSEKLYQ